MPRRNIADYLPQEYGQSREALPEYSKAQIYSSLSNKGKKELFESEQRIGQAPPTYDGFFGELGEVAADFPAAVARPLVSTAQELGFEWGDKAAKALEEYDSRHMDRRAPAGYSALDFRPGSLVRTVGNAAASTVPAVVLGTAGAAAGSLVSPGVGTAAGWTAGVMASFASTYGDEVKQMRQLLPDRTEEDVRTAALLSSGIQALIEVGMGPEAVLRKMVTNGGKKMVVAQTNAGVLQALKQFAKEHPVGIKGFLTQAVKSGGEEAGEEAMQYLTHLVVSKAFGSDEQFSGREMLENSFAGLVGGFFLGGVGYPLARWKQGGMQNAVTEGEYSFEGDNPDARKLSAMEMASRAMDMGLVTRDEVKENVPGKLGDTLVNAENLTSRLPDAVSAPDVESETQAVEETPQPEARHLDDTEQAVETARLFDEIFGTRTLINNDEVAAKIHEYADEKKATLSQEEQERFDEGRIEGVQEGDHFYLRGKGRDLIRIQGHEFKHWLDKEHPDLASYIDKNIDSLLNDSGRRALKREVSHYGDNADARGKVEFAADMFGGVLRDGKWRERFLGTLNRLDRDKQGIVESFLRAVKEFVNKITDYFGGKEQLSSTEQTLFSDYQKLSNEVGETLAEIAKRRRSNDAKATQPPSAPVANESSNIGATQAQNQLSNPPAPVVPNTSSVNGSPAESKNTIEEKSSKATEAKGAADTESAEPLNETDRNATKEQPPSPKKHKSNNKNKQKTGEPLKKKKGEKTSPNTSPSTEEQHFSNAESVLESSPSKTQETSSSIQAVEESDVSQPESRTETVDAPAAAQEQAVPQTETPTVSTPEAEAPAKPPRKKARTPSKPPRKKVETPAKSPRKKARALSKPQEVLPQEDLKAKGREGIEEFIDNWLWENRRQVTPESKEQAVEILLDEVKESNLREEDLLNMAARGDTTAENFIYEFLDFIDMSQSRGVDGVYEFDGDSIKNAAEAAIERNYGDLIDYDFDDNYDPTAKAKKNVRNSQNRRSGSYRWYDSPSEQDISGDEVASEQVNQVVDDGTSRAEYQEDIDNATHTRESRAEFDRLTRRMVARRGGRTPFARDVIEGRAPSDRYVLNAVRMLLNDPDAETVFTPEERKALRKKFIEGATQYGRDLASLRRRRVHALTEGEAMGIQLGIDALVESANDPEALRRKIAEDFGVDISNLSTEDLTTPERLNDILLGLYTQKATVWDKAYEVWINGILSGIKTHVVNTLGNTANLVYEFLPRRAAEALVNLFAKRPDGATFGELKYLWKNLGWRHAADAFRKVYAMETLGEGGKWSESSSGPAIKGPIGGIIRTPSRFLRAADAFAKALAHPAEASAYAYRIGKSQGLEGNALAEFISQEMETPESKSNTYADQRVLELTFQEDGGLAVRHLTNLRNKTPFGRYFLPFIKTPANLLRQGIRKGPLGLAGLLVDTYQIARGKGSVDNAYIAHAAEQIVAWGTALLLMGLHMDDDEPWITGNETEQYGTGEQQFRSRHIPPMSIRIGNNWFSYARIEPLSTGLAAFADGLAGLREASDGASVTSAVRKMISGTGRIVADRSYLDSVRQLMEIVQDPEKSAMDYASSYIGSWVPNIYRQMRNSVDENVPDYRNREKGNEWFSKWWEVTLSKAGLAERVPKRDYFGRTVPKDAAGSGVGAFLERLLSPFERKAADMDPMDRMLWEYNRRNPDSQYYPSLPAPTAKVNGRDVSFVENYDELCRVAGEQAYKELRFLAKTRRINTMKPSDRDIATVKSVLARARKRAREHLVRQHKEDRR